MIITESNQAKKGNLLLIGDLLIDQTWPVKATKLSPEGPIPVGQLSREKAIETPGGAGLAASFGTKNFKDMNLCFYTTTSRYYACWLVDKGIDTSCDIIPASKVVNKIRYIDEQSRYHLLRVDNDEVAGKSGLNLALFKENLETLLRDGLKGIVLLDYRKGIFDDDELIGHIISTAREYEIPVYVDSRAGDLKKFKDCNYLKLNDKEFSEACDNLDCLNERELIEVLGLESLIVTKGEEGAELHSKEEAYSYRALLDPHPGAPDVTGCGDAFDISFCYYSFIKRLAPLEALTKAVNMATDYAHMPIEERLC